MNIHTFDWMNKNRWAWKQLQIRFAWKTNVEQRLLPYSKHTSVCLSLSVGDSAIRYSENMTNIYICTRSAHIWSRLMFFPVWPSQTISGVSNNVITKRDSVHYLLIFSTELRSWHHESLENTNIMNRNCVCSETQGCLLTLKWRTEIKLRLHRLYLHVLAESSVIRLNLSLCFVKLAIA